MKAQYRILIGGTDYGIPKGLESIEIQVEARDFKIKTLTSGNLEFHKSIHEAGYNFIKSQWTADRCFELSWIMYYRTNSQNLIWGILDKGKIKGSGCTFFEPDNYVSMTLFSNSGIEKLENNQTDEYTDSPSVDVRMAQYESGGWLQEPDGSYTIRKMEPLADILTAIGTAQNTSIVINGPLTTTPIDHLFTLTIPSVNSGDVFVLQITSSFGSVFDLEITANISDTTTTIAEKICKGLLFIETPGATGYGITALEIIHRLKDVTYSSNEVTIRSDWRIDNFTCSQNGTAITPLEIQGYQWGIPDLYISSLGLNEDADIETSWGSIFNALKNIYGAVVLDSNPDIEISDHKTIFSSGPTSEVTDRPYTIKANEEHLKKRARYRQKFVIENQNDTNLNWNWIGVASEQDVSIIVPPVSTVASVSAAGIGTFIGSITYKNTGTTSETYTIDLEMDTGGGYIVIGSRTITIFPNQTYPPIELSTFFNSFSENSFCFAIGDNIRMVYSNTSNLTITASSVKISQGKPCFSQPQIREWAIYGQTFNDFSGMSNCDGTIDIGLDNSICTGMGYAAYQALTEGAYEDTTFLALTEDDGGDQVIKRFLRKLYFEDSANLDLAGCSCLKDSFVENYFWNLPLQWPYIIEQYRDIIPNDVEVIAYTFATTIDASDNFSQTRTVGTATIESRTNKRDLVDFDENLTVGKFLKIKSEKTGFVKESGSIKTAIFTKLILGFDGKSKTQETLI